MQDTSCMTQHTMVDQYSDIICHTGMLYSTYRTSLENTEFAFCSFVCPVFVSPLHDWALCISAAWAVSYWVATACVASHLACGEMLCRAATKVLGRRLESHDRSKAVMLTRLLNKRRCDPFSKAGSINGCNGIYSRFLILAPATRLRTSGLSYIHRTNKKTSLAAEEPDRGMDWPGLAVFGHQPRVTM